MNGPTTLYQTRQIVRHDLKVQLPNCMYKLKNIHASRNGMVDGSADHVSSPTKKLDIFDQNNHGIPGMAELEARQEKILQQLAELKKEMLSIKADLRNSSNSDSKPAPKACLLQTKPVGDLPDVIINANPNSPPYSLELVQKLWQDSVHFAVTSYVHSTVSSLSENARLLAQSLEQFKPKNDVPKMNVRLIWKDVSFNVELLVTHVPIQGEANVLRYLSRVWKNKLSYDSLPQSYDIDSLLDVCFLLARAKTKTERSNLLQILNKSLGKSQWLCGVNQFSVADLAAYSAIKSVPRTEVNVNIGKWLDRCASVA